VDIDVIGQQLLRIFIFVTYWRKSGSVMVQYISNLDFKKAYNSVKAEVLYNILSEFGIPRKLVGLSKTCLNETYSTIHIGKNLTRFLLRMA
jgi:hypothetical protein